MNILSRRHFAPLVFAWSLFLPFAVQAADKPQLTITWFDWQPCQSLKTLAATYPDATVTINCPDFSQWHSAIFTPFADKKGADLVILDSQWMGEAVKGGHIQDITKWMQANLPLTDYLPAAVSAYGEYPLGSGKLYGVAAQADTQVLVYRKDVFAASRFQPPSTWTELLKQAQSFQSAGAIQGFVTHWCGTPACYDQVQSAWNQIAWSFGGELWDPIEYRMLGVLDSPANVAALEFARQLVKTGPANVTDFQFNDVIDAMCSGKSAMATIWFGFAGTFVDPKACPQSANLGYAVVPGEARHYISLGGMGISVSSYSPNSEAALQFLAWFQADAQQIAWVKLGGVPARTSILASPAFTNAAPYNSVFAASYSLVKDFWNLPEYSQLLPIQGTLLNLALTGNANSQATLSAMATLQQDVIDLAYPAGPPFVPAVSPNGIVNGASYLGGPVAPGEVVSIFGTAIGPGIPTSYHPDPAGIATTLNETRVLFDNLAAPILFADSNQIIAVVPFGVSGKTSTSVHVEFLGKSTPAQTLTVAAAAPALFTLNQSGKGQLLAGNQDGTLNSTTQPAAKGSSILVFVTGAGNTTPASLDGILSGNTVLTPVLPVSLTIGGVAADSVVPVALPGMVAGVVALQAKLPAGAPTGDAVPVVVKVGTVTSAQAVTLAIR